MKKSSTLIAAFVMASSLFANTAIPDSTGLPGDQFSLEAALELFKNSADLQAFENALNMKDVQVNNLDLDGNGEVDYIRVVDHTKGDAHAIVLQVATAKDEAQDIAVIELEKTADRTAIVQIRGSEELYGKDVIFEPYDEQDVENAKGPRGPAPLDMYFVRVWVNVWDWPCVNYIYQPYYNPWISPWYYSYYPSWWNPWRPWGYHTYWGWHNNYHNWYQPTYVCRTQNANNIYQHRSSYSPRIRTATAPIREQRTTTLSTRTALATTEQTRTARSTELVAPRADRPTVQRERTSPVNKPQVEERPSTVPQRGTPSRTAPQRGTPERTAPQHPGRTRQAPSAPRTRPAPRPTQPQRTSPGRGSRSTPAPSRGAPSRNSIPSRGR